MGKQRSGKASKPYEVEYTSTFERRCSKLHEMSEDIEEAIDTIAVNPFVGEKLREKRFRGLYKYRIGKYRLFYRINRKEKICFLTDIKARGKAYK